MKTIKIIVIMLLFVAQNQIATAQFKWGAKVGIGTASLSPEIGDTSKPLLIGVKEAKYGYYFGAFASVKTGPVYLQPELLFNSNRIDYSFKDITKPSLDSIRTERYNFVDLPILVGFKLGFLRAKVGPVAHMRINSRSELRDVAGYEEKWKTAFWGYQAGISLNFSQKTHVDIRYEGNFDKWGSHINIGGTKYTFLQGRPSRFLVNLGYAF
jgi:opacity protein-like surface antigen